MRNGTATLEDCVVLSYKTNLPSPIDLGINLLDSYKNGLKSQIAHGLTHREGNGEMAQWTKYLLHICENLNMNLPNTQKAGGSCTCLYYSTPLLRIPGCFLASKSGARSSEQQKILLQARKEVRVNIWTCSVNSTHAPWQQRNTHTTHRQSHTDSQREFLKGVCL